MKACFTADDDNYWVRYKDGGLYLGLRNSNLYYKDGEFYSNSACSSTTGITKFSDAVSSMTSSGIIHMMGQYASSTDETADVPAGKNIQVVRDSSFKTESMFKITGGTFTVNAPNASSSITFDGKNIETSVDKGGAFYVDKGSTKFILNGADKSGGGKTITIENNVIYSSSETYGGGVYIKNGTITLTNCSITGNTASGSSYANGGGVCIYSNGTNTLTNCNITDNKATTTGRIACGGGVYIGDWGTNKLTNCNITGNTASGSSYANGGGVYINDGSNTLTNCSITKNTVSSNSVVNGGGVYIGSYRVTKLFGTTNITGNTAKVRSASSNHNFYFGISGKPVVLSDSSGNTLSTSSKIGITTSKAPTSGNDQKFATDATSAMASCFTPDNSSYKVTYSSSALSLAVK